MWTCEREATSSSVTSESEIQRLVHTTVDLATNVDMRETCEDEHGHAKSEELSPLYAGVF